MVRMEKEIHLLQVQTVMHPIAAISAILSFVFPVFSKIVVSVIAVCCMWTQVQSFQAVLPTAAAMQRQISLEERQRQAISRAFVKLWGHVAPRSYIEGVLLGTKSIRTRTVDPVLVAVLLHTESRGSINVVSSKGYRGLMQTDSSTGIPEADIMHGCKMLDEKLAWKQKNPSADLRIALALYKGGLSKTAFNQADQVLQQYKVIKKVIDS